MLQSLSLRLLGLLNKKTYKKKKKQIKIFFYTAIPSHLPIHDYNYHRFKSCQMYRAIIIKLSSNEDIFFL